MKNHFTRRHNYRSAAYRAQTKRVRIECWLRKKAISAAIPEPKRVTVPRVKAEFIIRITHRSGQSASLKCYRDVWGGLSPSVTVALDKIKTVLVGFRG